MSVPIWMLLGFTSWTILLLLFTVGIYRWSRILTRRATISSFRADQVEGQDWYKRAMRAHANCVENLPVFASLVFILEITRTSGPLIDLIAIIILVARTIQSLVHVSFIQTDLVVSIRFSFFLVQIISFLTLAILIAQNFY